MILTKIVESRVEHKTSKAAFSLFHQRGEAIGYLGYQLD